MNEKNIEELVELLYPYFLKKFKNDTVFKTLVRRKNATVTSSATNGSNVAVAFSYDKNSFTVRNETGVDLKQGDLVCIEYSIDLKNAIAVYKVT